jgi:hypothetical protein
MSKKLSAQEYAEMRSEDPSQLIENAGMDISPSSPYKTPGKIAAGAVDKNDNDAAAQIAEMQAKIKQLELEKKAMETQIVSPVTTASGGRRPNYTHTHPPRHVAVKEAAEPVLVELRKIANNPDAIWWVDKHVEALGLSLEKPDWHKSYKDWAKDEKIDAIEAFLTSVQVAQ